jgi:hypothetical protein
MQQDWRANPYEKKHSILHLYQGLTCPKSTMYFYVIMHTKKEKRLHERVPLPEVRGMVEISETIKPITVVNASSEGVCIAGIHVEVGSVVRLEIESPQDMDNISLYCKVAWATDKEEHEKLSGLSFLNTNKILFKKDLVSYNKLLDQAICLLNTK